LVRVGLWEVAPAGYQFHDWADYQPTKEQVLSRRASSAERVTRWREKKSLTQAPPPTHDACNAVTYAVTNAARNAVTNAARNAVRNAPPDPTRPDPSRPDLLTEIRESAPVAPVASPAGPK